MKKMTGVEAGVWAVVVTYNPDTEILQRLISALVPQVAGVVVVDNASSPNISTLLRESDSQNVILIPMHENLGIAEAQNAGVEQAMRYGAEFIYLSDQDSVPSETLVAELLAVLISNHACPVAAVGPATVDTRTGHVSTFVVERYRFPRRWRCPSGAGKSPHVLEVGFLIASGTLIPIDVIKRIGGMRSQYFIDHVDTEWCFRAKTAGYVLLGVPSVLLEHQLGDSVSSVWFFGWRNVMYHSPLRDYYMFRNTILMIGDVSMSWIWRGYLIWRLVMFAGYFLTFSSDRWLRLKRMSLGLIHGLRRRSGRFDIATGRCHQLPETLFESEGLR